MERKYSFSNDLGAFSHGWEIADMRGKYTGNPQGFPQDSVGLKGRISATFSQVLHKNSC